MRALLLLLLPRAGIEDLREKREGMLKQIADEEGEKVKVRSRRGWSHGTLRVAVLLRNSQPFESPAWRRLAATCCWPPCAMASIPVRAPMPP